MSFSSPKVQAEYYWECNELFPCLDSLYEARDSANYGWQYPLPIKITPDSTNCPECTVDWYYRFRNGDPACPDTEDQYEFLSMVVNDVCFYDSNTTITRPACANPPYKDMLWEDMFKEAYFAGLTAFMESFEVNKYTFPDTCGPVMEGYYMANCAKKIETPTGYIMANCEFTEQACCEQQLQYCNGRAKVLTTSGGGPMACGIDGIDSVDCFSRCDWNIGDVYKRSYSLSEKPILGIQVQSRIITNSLEFETEESGSVQLIIYDMNGSERLNQRVELSSKFNVNIDFETGMYFFFLTSDDGRNTGGQFIVNR